MYGSSFLFIYSLFTNIDHEQSFAFSSQIIYFCIFPSGLQCGACLARWCNGSWLCTCLQCFAWEWTAGFSWHLEGMIIGLKRVKAQGHDQGQCQNYIIHPQKKRQKQETLVWAVYIFFLHCYYEMNNMTELHDFKTWSFLWTCNGESKPKTPVKECSLLSSNLWYIN